ncbi:hypothetical protein BM536_006115 [Streptomyces phaeoluteigriseus]|uniref:Uncharacterized protein n=1 Tax=Streptomyces phaeoluteigriseus TaxID=114686 RepID=A0A1V6MX92_9ACTN|nr:hypothetical protein BM536_006115 [Streptomyces phaeoluteigriseus]
MAVQDELLETTEVAVLDPFSLYRIAVGHTPGGRTLGNATRTGTIRLITPAVAFAVACSMRTCWDETCDLDHRDGTGVPVRRFQEIGGIEVVSLSPAETVSAGQLYAASMDRRVVGAEVLAACHAAVLAKSSGSPLISAARASYCYSALDRAEVSFRIDLV